MSVSGSAVSLGCFEEKDYKIRKGNARLNCLLEIVGETNSESPDFVVKVTTRSLTKNGVKIGKNQ